jgi:hypothetical protein
MTHVLLNALVPIFAVMALGYFHSINQAMPR